MLTVKSYLEKLVEILNSNSDKKYIINCFEYPIEYGYRDKITYEPMYIQKENFIAITTADFLVDDIFQGFLCYPEEYPDFYQKKDFILCFHLRDDINFDYVLNQAIDDLDLYKSFYGMEAFGLKEKACKSR